MKALGVNQTEAILLHSRNYSETSLICELFTRKHGRVSVIAKGARSKKNKFQNIAAPNILASVNYSGKSELKTLVSWEEISHFSILTTKGLQNKYPTLARAADPNNFFELRHVQR